MSRSGAKNVRGKSPLIIVAMRKYCCAPFGVSGGKSQTLPMALRALRRVSRHTGSYFVARSWTLNTTRTLTVSATSHAAEKGNVTHTGQVCTTLSLQYSPKQSVWVTYFTGVGRE